jgi:hypothetical protein
VHVPRRDRKLDHLAANGITALELMPLADFPGHWNWGYDGVLPFAPDSRYWSMPRMRAASWCSRMSSTTISGRKGITSAASQRGFSQTRRHRGAAPSGVDIFRCCGPVLRDAYRFHIFRPLRPRNQFLSDMFLGSAP